MTTAAPSLITRSFPVRQTNECARVLYVPFLTGSQTLLYAMYAWSAGTDVRLYEFAVAHVCVCVGRFSILVGVKCLEILSE